LGLFGNIIVKNYSLQDWEKDLKTSLFMRQSKAGINVNESTAIKMSAVLGSVLVLSQTLASMPLILYKDRKRGDKSSGKDRHVDHPLYDLVKTAPNDEIPAMVFKETMMSHMTLSGNGYAQIIRSRRGDILSLDILPWWQMEAKRNYNTGKIEYWTNDRGKQIQLDSKNVLHIPGLSFDGVTGYSPIKMAMEAIGLGLAAEHFAGYFYSNGANIGGVITMPGHIQDPGSLKEELGEKFEGLGKAHKVMFLEDGMKFEKVIMPLAEAQFLETRKFQVEEIARIYRVPLHLLQNLDKATNNNIEHQSLEFVMYTMLPWFTRWEQWLNFKLLTKEERQQGLFFEFLLTALLRADTAARSKMLHEMRQDGIINADEWRELENMNPQEGEYGKTYYINGNMISTETAAKQQPRQTNTGGGGKLDA